ncbi:MAG: HipA N-terminal domain-containing protein [Akkermansia sp.]
MRKALVLLRNIPAGTLTEESPSSYVFQYLEAYLLKENLPPVSLTMPKTSEEYRSPHLFPVFFRLRARTVSSLTLIYST